MYTSETIQNIHRELQSLTPQCTVLLGGSYLYGEATDDSDLDFYTICHWRDLLSFARYRKHIEEIKKKYAMVRCCVTVVPHWLFIRGWYYIYGQDTTGRVHRSAMYPALIIRNSLKLGLYHYLRVLTSEDLHARQIRLIKSAQQLAAAIIFAKKLHGPEPYFSLCNLIQQLQHVDYNKFGILITLLECKLNNEPFSLRSTIIAERVLGKVQEFIYQELKPHVNIFSFPNYIIYNVRFLLKGKSLFLFRNPDKMIIEYLRAVIYRHEDLKDIERLVKQIVFPVLII